MAWWDGLTLLNKVFYCAGGFFGVLFIWQMIAAFIGLGGDEGDADADADVDVDHDVDADVDHDATYDEFEHGAEADATETMSAFRLLGLRSVLTFFTLFTWGMALYLNTGMKLSAALPYSLLWGMAGMFIIALIFHWMRKLTETGTATLHSCVGTEGEVYLDIPQGGLGEVRATVGRAVTYVKARGAGGMELKAGTAVHIRRRLNQTTIEVESIRRQTQDNKE